MATNVLVPSGEAEEFIDELTADAQVQRGATIAELVDALEDLAGELQVRADDLRAEMRAAPAEPGPDAEEGS